MILSIWVKNLINNVFDSYDLDKQNGFYPYEYMIDAEKC